MFFCFLGTHVMQHFCFSDLLYIWEQYRKSNTAPTHLYTHSPTSLPERHTHTPHVNVRVSVMAVNPSVLKLFNLHLDIQCFSHPDTFFTHGWLGGHSLSRQFACCLYVFLSEAVCVYMLVHGPVHDCGDVASSRDAGSPAHQAFQSL